MRRFEKWAVNSFSGLYLHWYLLPRLFALMDGPLKGTGLALGPGVGFETLAIAERFRDTRLIGVDYDPDQVERARGNLACRPALAGRVAFREGDATALRFPDEEFDFLARMAGARCEGLADKWGGVARSQVGPARPRTHGIPSDMKEKCGAKSRPCEVRGVAPGLHLDSQEARNEATVNVPVGQTGDDDRHRVRGARGRALSRRWPRG